MFNTSYQTIRTQIHLTNKTNLTRQQQAVVAVTAYSSVPNFDLSMQFSILSLYIC